jgi:Glycosyl hydrolases family 16
VPDACAAFHDYQMHWTVDTVRFGIDGQVFLTLNIAVGGDLGGAVDDAAFPVSTEVEHVRAHRAPPP